VSAADDTAGANLDEIVSGDHAFGPEPTVEPLGRPDSSTTMATRRTLRAMVVGPDAPERLRLLDLLREQHLSTLRMDAMAASLGEAETMLARAPPDLVVVDLPRRDAPNGATNLERILALSTSPAAPHVVVATDEDCLTDPEDLGAMERVFRPVTASRLEQCLRRLTTTLSRPVRVAARRGRSLVFLDEDEVLACEADGRLTYVHAPFGRFDLDLSLTVLRARLGRLLVRVHRCWLVNTAHVRECEISAGETTLLVGSDRDDMAPVLRVPVSSSHARAVRELLLRNTVGLRESRHFARRVDAIASMRQQ
jgi:DNA-binding LytR/AlgR family response regulator